MWGIKFKMSIYLFYLALKFDMLCLKFSKYGVECIAQQTTYKYI